MKRLDAVQAAVIELRKAGMFKATLQLELRDFVLLFAECVKAQLVRDDAAAPQTTVLDDDGKTPVIARIPLDVVYNGLCLHDESCVITLAGDDQLTIVDAYGKR